jgi:transcriptional regulator with XRE-family HTH domain
VSDVRPPLRQQRKLTQEQLAFAVAIDLTYLGGIERGRKNPSLMVMARIAECALRVAAQAIQRLTAKVRRYWPAEPAAQPSVQPDVVEMPGGAVTAAPRTGRWRRLPLFAPSGAAGPGIAPCALHPSHATQEPMRVQMAIDANCCGHAQKLPSILRLPPIDLRQSRDSTPSLEDWLRTQTEEGTFHDS